MDPLGIILVAVIFTTIVLLSDHYDIYIISKNPNEPEDPENTENPEQKPKGPKDPVDPAQKPADPEDPLEQFDVLSVAQSFADVGLTNLSLLLGFNLVVMALWFASFNANVTSTYDYTLRALYQLVRAMVKENLYIRKQQFFTVLFYLFFTLLISNLVGMIPYAFTTTSSFIVTFFLAMTHFVAINHIAIVKSQWQVNDLFLPSGAPLLIAPFLIFIEAVSYIARVFSLSIRLFANMMSGHALLKILIGFSYVLLCSGSAMILLALVPWAIVTAIMYLELLIAFLQGYVFTILVTLYTNDALNTH